MASGRIPRQFHRKTWIYWVQVMFASLFGGGALAMGMVLGSGLLTDVNGRPVTGPGRQMGLVGAGILAYGVLCLVNVRARKAPVIELFRQGLIVDRCSVELIDREEQPPGSLALILAWATRRDPSERFAVVRWRELDGIEVVGPSLKRMLVLTGRFHRLGDRPSDEPLAGEYGFLDAVFAGSVSKVGEHLTAASRDEAFRRSLPSWGREEAGELAAAEVG